MTAGEVPVCVCGHPIADHAMNYVPGRNLDRRGACRTCGVHANGNLPCPSYLPEVPQVAALLEQNKDLRCALDAVRNFTNVVLDDSPKG